MRLRLRSGILRFWLYFVWFSCLFGISSVNSLAQQPAADACPDDTLPARLVVGEYARVTYDTQLNFRSEPSTAVARVGVVSSGMMFPVVSGPICAGGYRWWEITVDTVNGWVAEGNASSEEYWLEPRGKIITVEDADGLTRAYVVDAEGKIIERANCMKPPEDYTLIEWGYATFNVRTAAMLDHAQRLYTAMGGTLNLKFQISQGSYAPGLAASFGTHDGGGAVDIAVREPSSGTVLHDEIPWLLDALRTAGFAAWLRDTGELYPNSPIHIHAIAVGDAELSPAARQQIDGLEGYLRGFNGLPQPEGQPPVADIYGDPVICRWMVEMGFDDLRTSS